MTIDSIAEVGIDEKRQLFARPSTAAFPYIYREAVDIHWEPNRAYLHATEPRDWTYLQCFQAIIGAAALQGYDLQLTTSTAWTNVPEDLRLEIGHWFATRPPKAPETEQARQQRERTIREQNYLCSQAPRLKAEARRLFMDGRYSDVVRIESEIQYPEFLTPAERQLFALARQRQ